MFRQALANDNDPANHSNGATNIASNHHSTGGIPSALQDSPYLSSPIRPIPSFKSVSTRKTKRFATYDSRASSPRSTVGSLRLASPYSQSIYSLQSLSSTVSTNGFQRGNSQALNRSVLLPHEIDHVEKILGVTSTMKNIGNDFGDGNHDCDSFDFDDSTVNSDSARSINDRAVFEYIANENDDEFNLGELRISTLSASISKDDSGSPATVERKAYQRAKNSLSEPKLVRLPLVETDRDIFDGKATRKKKVKNANSRKKVTGPILKSPYAQHMNNPMRTKDVKYFTTKS